jgi:hypothetical protein
MTAAGPSVKRPGRRPLAIAAVLALVVALSAAGYWWTRAESGTDAAGHATVTVAPPPAPATTSRRPVPALVPSATPKPKPTAKPRERPKAKPPIPHEFVAAAAPTAFRIAGPRFRIDAQVCGMDNVRPLDPPGEQHHTVCWVQEGFGVAPGSRSATTYILGHAWAQDSLEVLNKMSAQATQEILRGPKRYVGGVATYPVRSLRGYLITLRTATGVLNYRVSDAYGVAKSQAASVAPLMNEQTKRRVVIITCAELNGVDYDFNVIVEARLSSSVADRT